MEIFNDKVVVILGGTGSIGKVLTRRLLNCELGKPRKIIIFSRDEAKQHYMRLEYQCKKSATDEIIYDNFRRLLEFRIGDIRNYESVCSVLRGADIAINAAALKQVPSCEYFPQEAVMTNILGPQNIIRAINEQNYPIQTVIGISTDKACKPVNVMGMTKALEQRLLIGANILSRYTKFICVRYGNVLASRGSVIPLFHDQIKNGGPVTITTEDMTRFLLSLDQAVDTIFAAITHACAGETFVPKIPSARIVDIARAMIKDREIEIKITGIRPGEKIHEILVSEEEGYRAYENQGYYAIQPMLPELIVNSKQRYLKKEYSSKNSLMGFSEIMGLLQKNNILTDKELVLNGGFLR